MNVNNFNIIIQEYINHFELINNDEHREFSKWYAFKRYKDKFDINADDFALMFKDAIKEAAWLVDNAFVCPTNGVAYLASKEETKEHIRDLFIELYSEDNGDLIVRQNKIFNFRDKFNDLLNKYEPNKWKYKQDFRCVLLYLTLMYPEQNYLFKSSQANPFRECIEFTDSFGSGEDFSLKKYYQMCDAIVDKINDTPELVEMHKSRINNDMYQDINYHLLAFDIIYCAVAYGMYAGIEIRKPSKMTKSEREEYARQQDLQNQLVEVQAELNTQYEIFDDIQDVSIVGMKIEHKDYGVGTVIEQNGTIVSIEFNSKIMKFQFPTAFKVGKLVVEDETIIEFFTQLFETTNTIKKLEERISSIKRRIK